MQSITTAVTILAAEGEGGHGHVVNELIFPAPVFGIGFFVVFMALLLITLSISSVGLRHEAPGAEVAHRGHGGGHGGHDARGSHSAGH